MKTIKGYLKSKEFIYWSIMAVLIISCEDVVEVPIDDAEPQLVVDAWVNTLDEPQDIRLSWSQSYFDATASQKISDAQVVVSGNNGDILNFLEEEPGVYIWSPNFDIQIHEIGVTYTLSVWLNGELWTSESTLNRVPPIDSISQEFRDDELFGPDGIYANFFARDPEGTGDTYWIKTFKNGEFLNKPLELNIAYDAGFDPGAEVDGLIFITPIRELVNRVPDSNDAEDNNDVPPWAPGDSIYVEIHSLNDDAWSFLDITYQQITNGENGIFTLPIANAQGNVVNDSTGNRALGVFCVSAVSALGSRIE